MPIRDAVLKGRGFKPLPLNAHSRRCFERARLQAAPLNAAKSARL
jgi:hypothetical protein